MSDEIDKDKIDKGNYRMENLKEQGYDNTTCRRCKAEGEAVLEAGDYTVIVYLCPECSHLWGVNYDEKEIEEIPKEVDLYDEMMEKLREEYQDYKEQQ